MNGDIQPAVATASRPKKFNSWLPSIMTGLGSLASQGVNYLITKKFNEDAFKRNKELSERAFERNLQIMREQNAYNSEAAQAIRSRAAGLDPNAGQITSHASADVSPLEFPTYDPQIPQFDIGGSIGSGFQSFRDMEMLRLSDIKTSADAAKLQAEVDEIGANIMLKDAMRDYYKSQGDYNYMSMQKRIDQIQLDNDIKTIMKQWMPHQNAADYLDTIADINLKLVDASFTEAQITEVAFKCYNLLQTGLTEVSKREQLNALADYYRSAADLNDEQAKVVATNTLCNVAQSLAALQNAETAAQNADIHATQVSNQYRLGKWQVFQSYIIPVVGAVVGGLIAGPFGVAAGSSLSMALGLTKKPNPIGFK